MLELILGGARSGKTRQAQQRAEDSQLDVIYIATATAGDAEMATRIERHKMDRPQHWLSIEEPISLAATIQANDAVERCIIVDCLSLWLSNCLHQGCWTRQKEDLLLLLPEVKGHLIFVSNETGLGVVPMGEISRQFVDESGFLHQALAAHCEKVCLMVAGLSLSLK
ncbi:MAG: bifunctional adenosylcobinamide kinase/adenosylcobinamide-phosphate guanylyltransferase [Pseudomonadales bacterium]